MVTLKDVQRIFSGKISKLNRYFNLQIIVVVLPEPLQEIIKIKNNKIF